MRYFLLDLCVHHWHSVVGPRPTCALRTCARAVLVYTFYKKSLMLFTIFFKRRWGISCRMCVCITGTVSCDHIQHVLQEHVPEQYWCTHFTRNHSCCLPFSLNEDEVFLVGCVSVSLAQCHGCFFSESLKMCCPYRVEETFQDTSKCAAPTGSRSPPYVPSLPTGGLNAPKVCENHPSKE